jgi:serine/threonine protein kinase
MMKFFRRNLRMGLSEAAMLSSLQQNPFIVRMLDCFVPSGSVGLEQFVIVMECLRPLPPPSSLSIGAVRSLAKQLLQALASLHDGSRVAHLDIKPHNLMMIHRSASTIASALLSARDIDGQLRLIDVGLAAPIVPNVSLPCQGTRGFMAPEIGECWKRSTAHLNSTHFSSSSFQQSVHFLRKKMVRKLTTTMYL